MSELNAAKQSRVKELLKAHVRSCSSRNCSTCLKLREIRESKQTHHPNSSSSAEQPVLPGSQSITPSTSAAGHAAGDAGEDDEVSFVRELTREERDVCCLHRVLNP